MKVRTKLVLAALAVAVVAAGALGGLVSNGQAAHRATLKFAVVTDVGGINDKGFNSLAAAGLATAEAKLGVQGRDYITQTAADRQPNLVAAAQSGYDLVFATGVLFAFGPLPTAAAALPNTKFVGIDIAQSDMGTKPIPNVLGIQFREQEAGCLVGNIAALEMLREHHNTISAVGANKVPAIVRYIAGYKYCAGLVSKKIKVLVNYANDPTFADQTKCKATAVAQIARGSHVIFQVAGACGLGALDAAKTAGVWGIGVDADQGFLGPYMLTSARKRVDQAVFDTIKSYTKDPSSFKGGTDKVYSLKNQGVGFGTISHKLPEPVRKMLAAKTNLLARQIIAGKITPPTQ